MRTLICGSIVFVLAGMVSGCASSGESKSDATTATQTCVMPSGGVNVLRLTLPAATKCVATDGALRMKSPDFELEVWLVSGAQTVDEGVGHVDKQIETEFRDFKPDQISDLTVAGAPAKRLAGKGHEADDGDDGDADVIVFKVGGHVFVALTHDERLNPPARAGLVSAVQSAAVQ